MKQNLVLLIIILLCSLALKGQTNFEKRSQIKGQKTKSSKIKYKWNEGKALLKSGLQLDGKFRFKPSDNDIPEYEYIEKGDKDCHAIALTMFASLNILGTERGISAFKDSTKYRWVDGYDNLMRIIRDGEIVVYDNSKVIDEKYKGIDDYILVAERSDFGKATINNVKDLAKLMSDRPYFMESAKATGKIESRDLRVAIYLIDLFNDKNPMESLKWEKGTITLKDNSKLHGQVIIQPMDLLNEYTSGKFAYVHFHDGKKFRLLRNDEISNLNLAGVRYEEGYFSLSNKFFFGIKWVDENNEYLVAPRILNKNSYFFTAKQNDGQNLVVLEKVVGVYARPNNEIQLRAKYLQK